jgi:DNA polymerase-1
MGRYLEILEKALNGCIRFDLPNPGPECAVSAVSPVFEIPPSFYETYGAATEPTACAISPPFTLVTRQADLQSVTAAIDDTGLVGLDLETSGLDPREDRIRLLSLALDTCDVGERVYLVDCFTVDPSPLWPHLHDAAIVGHNLAFDLQFMARCGGFVPGTCFDTLLMSKVLSAGPERLPHDLKSVCERHLGLTISKDEQKSDWTADDLTDEQLKYAALDAELPRLLHAKLKAEIEASFLTRIIDLEHRCLPAAVWLADAGIKIDQDAWLRLANEHEAEATRLAAELDRIAAPRSGGTRNWNSVPQVREALAAAGHQVTSTSSATLAQLHSPLAATLRDYRKHKKLATTYGHGWAKKHIGHGHRRVFAHWNQLGTVTGRMSCGSPTCKTSRVTNATAVVSCRPKAASFSKLITAKSS